MASKNSLLQMNRRLNHFIQQNDQDFIFSKFCQMLSDLLKANVYIIDNKGNTLGCEDMQCSNCEQLTPKKTPKREFSSCLNNLLQQGRTVFNLKLEGETCLYNDHLPCSTEQAQQKIIIIRPIRHGAQRIGSLVVIKFGGAFNLDALVLLETALSCATIELLKRESKNNTKEIYKQTLARTAIQALSFSEKQIVDKLISELNHKDECIIIARKLAKSLNVSHSVLICALRKLESAGLIKSRSLGAKGTHISLLNPYLRSSI